jgi:hypothetical protein
MSVLFLATSCSSEKEVSSGVDMFTSKKWVVNKYEEDGTDVTDSYQTACSTDNYLKFSKDGTYREFVGRDKCDAHETDEIGTWHWNKGKKTFSIHPSDDTATDWKVVAASASTIKIARHDDADGATLEITLTAM